MTLPLSSLLIALLLGTSSAPVFADYDVRVILDAFMNPDNQLADGRCCSDLSTGSTCTDSCNERLRICLRGANHSTDDTESCPLFEIANLNVDPRGITFPSIPGAWPEEIQILFTITDSPSGNIIDQIFVDVTVEANSPLSESSTYSGGHGRVTLVFRLQVECSVGFYGSNCNSTSPPPPPVSSSPAPSPSPSMSPTPSPSPVASVSPSFTMTPSPSPSVTPSPSPSLSSLLFSSVSPSPSLEVSPSPLPSTEGVPPVPSPSPVPSISSEVVAVALSSPSPAPSNPTITPPLTPDNRGLSIGGEVGVAFGVILGLVLLVLLALIVGFLILVTVRRRQHIHRPTRNGHLYFTESTSTADSNTIAVRYTANSVSQSTVNGTSSEQTIPPGYRTAPNLTPMKSSPQKQGRLGELDTTNLMFDTEAGLSVSSFETTSRHSTVDPFSEVTYSEVLKTKGENEGNQGNKELTYADVAFQVDQ